MRAATPATLIAGMLAFGMASGARADLSNQLIQPPEIVAGLKGEWNSDATTAESAIEFCATNVCDVFRYPTAGDETAVYDFIYLYFAFVKTSNLPWIEQFGLTEPAERIRDVLTRHSSGCADNDALVRCVLAEMAERYDIRLAYSRYDEMARHEVPFDLSDQLDRIYSDRLGAIGLGQ